MKEHPTEDDLKLLRWNDEQLDGKGYVDWYEFDHPQLGKVELGGWDVMYCWGNVPPQFLEARDRAALGLGALASADLAAARSQVAGRGAAWGRGRTRCGSSSRTPAGCRRRSPRRRSSGRRCGPLEVELTLPEGAELVAGELKTEAGQLEGRVHKRSVLWWGGDDSTADLTKLEWVIEAPEGGELGIEARHQRAGTVREVVSLGGNA